MAPQPYSREFRPAAGPQGCPPHPGPVALSVPSGPTLGNHRQPPNPPEPEYIGPCARHRGCHPGTPPNPGLWSLKCSLQRETTVIAWGPHHAIPRGCDLHACSEQGILHFKRGRAHHLRMAGAEPWKGSPGSGTRKPSKVSNASQTSDPASIFTPQQLWGWDRALF